MIDPRFGIPAALAALTLVLLGGPASAKERPADRITWQMLTVRLSGRRLYITDAVRFATALSSAVELPTFVGARDLSGRGFSRPAPGAVLVPPGVGSATLRYTVPLPSQGLSVAWREPLAVTAFWVRTGPGVDLPIELNQAFYPEGASAGGGIDAPLSLAREVPAGPLRLNFEFSPPLPTAFTAGFWEVFGFVAIGVTWVWWARRPRPSPTAMDEGGGGDDG